jgi:hypothetical protein
MGGMANTEKKLWHGVEVIIEGHAAVRAATPDGQHEAHFICPGAGTGEHCFRRARALAREAGFIPMDEPNPGN